MDKIASKLNRYNLKTREQIESAVAKAVKGKQDLFDIKVDAADDACVR